MSKILIVMISVLLVAACSSQESNAGKKTTAKPSSMLGEDLNSNPVYVKGKELIAKNDCLTCHKEAEKLIGPPYRDVANKYADHPEAVELLAEKVMKGGTGVWGQVPMAAHPNLSKEDAVALVQYIMLLKS